MPTVSRRDPLSGDPLSLEPPFCYTEGSGPSSRCPTSPARPFLSTAPGRVAVLTALPEVPTHGRIAAEPSRLRFLFPAIRYGVRSCPHSLITSSSAATSGEPGHKRGCCDPGGRQALRDAFKKELKKAGFGPLARANHAGCLEQCEHGPTVVIYPQGIWYGRVDARGRPADRRQDARRGRDPRRPA